MYYYIDYPTLAKRESPLIFIKKGAVPNYDTALFIHFI